MAGRPVLGLCVVVCTAAAVTALGLSRQASAAHERQPDALTTWNAAGQLRTLGISAADLDNPFFRDLGANGRTCFSCHQPDQGWTITPERVRQRFEQSRGLDPIFRTNDGSNCEGADLSTLRRRRDAYSLLLNRALIRIALDVPAGAQFIVDSVDDPYRCGAPLASLSLYRRPLPTTNLGFLSAVMWDGRESSASTTIAQDLAKQADTATLGHAQASAHLTPQEAAEIVAFETGLVTAQVRDWFAGSLHTDGATGGPGALSTQPFFIGINDPVGLNPTGQPFDPNAFTLFGNWANRQSHNPADRPRRAIARGERLFNTRPIVISGVAGLNNETFSSGVTVPEPFTGTCTTCHDTPNAGNHSVKAPLDIGIASAARRTPDLPLYTLRRISTGETVQTTDPGRAMITGKWADVGKFKGPILRGLPARAPYFHNGMAATLDDVVEFYETRFGIGLTAQEKADLVAFLRAL